jgi:hypothetical protein
MLNFPTEEQHVQQRVMPVSVEKHTPSGKSHAMRELHFATSLRLNGWHSLFNLIQYQELTLLLIYSMLLLQYTTCRGEPHDGKNISFY